LGGRATLGKKIHRGEKMGGNIMQKLKRKTSPGKKRESKTEEGEGK